MLLFYFIKNFFFTILFLDPPMQESETINAAKVDDQTRPGSIVRVPEPTPPPNSPQSIPHTHGYQRYLIFGF